MTHVRFSVKALGFSLAAVLGAAAFVASGAQANWLVTPNEKAVITKVHKEFVLSVPTKSLEILCSTVSTEAGTAIKFTPLASMLGTLSFANCQTFQPTGTLNVNCKPKEPITAKGKGQVFLHESEEYILLEGDEEVSKEVVRFARVDFPEACALPDTNVGGAIVLECLNLSLSTSGSCLEHTVSHLIQEAPAALFPSDVLKYGVNTATISGIANAELTSGEAWSAHV